MASYFKKYHQYYDMWIVECGLLPSIEKKHEKNPKSLKVTLYKCLLIMTAA